MSVYRIKGIDRDNRKRNNRKMRISGKSVFIIRDEQVKRAQTIKEREREQAFDITER